MRATSLALAALLVVTLGSACATPQTAPAVEPSTRDFCEKDFVSENPEGVEGHGFTEIEVRVAMDKRFKEIRACHENAIKMNPDTAGTLLLHFLVDAGGKVINSCLRDSSVPKSLEDCVIDVVTTTKFPKPRGGGTVAVTYPFRFSVRR